MDEHEVKDALKSLGIRADRNLGQHFLLDQDIAERSVSYASITGDETVLEVGPGLGILTRLLSARAGRVVAIEKERRFVGLVGDPNVEYIHGDAVKVDLPEFDKVVSNLPYGISSPLTFRLLESGHRFKVAVLMYQKEFAERMASGPGSKTYSRLSISAYVRARVELLDRVDRTAFFPIPGVDSCIVKLTPREPPFTVPDWKVFHNVVRAAFNQRRKKLRNSIKNGVRQLGLPSSISKTKIDFDRIPYADKRPERLTPEQFGEITSFLFELL
jgi:16S rRNA (adenine1518-N6/adenine1519-N6)-dimethyltransferase